MTPQIANPLLLMLPPQRPAGRYDKFIAWAFLGTALWLMIRKPKEIRELSNPGPRNIVNVGDIDGMIDIIIQRDIPPENVQTWLKRNFKNYMLRDYENIVDVTESYQSSTPTFLAQMYKARPWLKKLVESKATLYGVQTQLIRDDLIHVVDFFSSPEAPRHIDRISVPEAIRQANLWTEKLSKKKVDKNIARKGERLIKKYPDGFTWKELVSDEALDLEGVQMQHCVGSYAERVHRGEAIIWSLRDSKNLPHCTIQLSHGTKEVIQIKGKQNSAVIEKYHSYVQDLLKTTLDKFDVDAHELRNVGLIKVKDKVYTIEEIKEKPDVVALMIRKHLPPNKEIHYSLNIDSMDKYGVYLGPWYLHDLLQFFKDYGVYLGHHYTNTRLLEMIEDTDSYPEFSMEHEDVTYLLESLEKKHPKTYAKIQKSIAKEAKALDHPYDEYKSGKWFKDIATGYYRPVDSELSDEAYQLTKVHHAMFNAIDAGWSSGNNNAAYKYVLNMLDDLNWTDHSLTYGGKEKNTLGFMLSWDSLISGDDLRLDDASENRLDQKWRGQGYDHEIDESAAIERFYEALQEEDFKVLD